MDNKANMAALVNKLEAIPGIKNEPNFAQKLAKHRIRLSDFIEVPVPCFEIINVIGIGIPFSTFGNYSAVIAKAKAGKSFTMCFFLAAALMTGVTFQNVLRANFPENKRVSIYFDTEQSTFHVHRALKRICSVAGITLDPENLEVYSLRSLTPNERLDFIEYTIYNTPNIGYVVIDGIRDLITSINDEEQASMVIGKLLKWTEEQDIHITTVLHQNKNDQNARGHVGTELINKAETVISITKDSQNPDVRIISPEQCRDIEFEPLAFMIDENGLPHFITGYEPNKGGDRLKKSVLEPNKIDIETHKLVVNQLYDLKADYLFKELWEMTQTKLSIMFPEKISRDRAVSWVKHWQVLKLVSEVGTAGTKSRKYLKGDFTNISNALI
jgi:hypothetical protein